MATPLTVETRVRDDGAAVLAVSGEIDLSNIELFTRAIADAMTPASRDGGVLTIDLTDVEYLDSAAIDTLFGHADRIRLIVNPILMPVLKVSGLTNVTSVDPGQHCGRDFGRDTVERRHRRGAAEDCGPSRLPTPE